MKKLNTFHTSFWITLYNTCADYVITEPTLTNYLPLLDSYKSPMHLLLVYWDLGAKGECKMQKFEEEKNLNLHCRSLKPKHQQPNANRQHQNTVLTCLAGAPLIFFFFFSWNCVLFNKRLEKTNDGAFAKQDLITHSIICKALGVRGTPSCI